MGVKVREKVQGSGVFWVFIHHHGKRVSKQVGSEGAAQKAAEQIQARLTLGRDALPKQKPKLPTLQVYYRRIKKSYLETATRPSTQASYETSFKHHINPQLGSKPLDQISKADVRDLISRLVAKDLSKATIKVIIAALSAVMNHAIEDELIIRNLATKCSKFYKQAPVRHEEIQPLNAKEIRLLLRTILNDKHSSKYYALFLCAIHTGMRSGEIVGLQWEDIDWNGKFATVRRAYVRGRVQPTKTDRVRRVDLSDALLEALRDHRQAKRQEWLKKGVNKIPRWVFASREGSPLDMYNVKNRHFYPNLTKAGLRRIRFHDLRHTYASLLIQNGEPLAYIKEQLGHSSIRMTVDVYGHLEPGANRQAVNRLPTLESARPKSLEGLVTAESPAVR